MYGANIRSALFGSRRALDFLWVALVVAELGLLSPWRTHRRSIHSVGCQLWADAEFHYEPERGRLFSRILRQ